jgi:DNA-binding NtrC family response regulator
MNVLERAALSCQDNLIRPSDIQAAIVPELYGIFGPFNKPLQDEIFKFGNKPLKEMVQDTERRIIIKALHQCNGSQTKAASLLHVRRKNFWKKIQKHSIDVASFRDNSKQNRDPDSLSRINRAA